MSIRENHEINREYIIRVYPSLNGKSNNSILSAKTFKDLVGDDLALKHIEKATERGQDKYVFKLRRGLRFELVVK